MPKKTNNQTKTESKRDLSPAIAVAVLGLVAERGWAGFDFVDIADAMAEDEATIYAHAADKAALMHLVFRYVDECVAKAIEGGIHPDMPVKERLFEVMMARFDVLQEYRDGFMAILGDLRRDLCGVVTALPHVGQSMSRMLTLAGEEPHGPIGAARILGLMTIYLHTLKVWQEDKSPDMGRVMATIDRDLDRAARLEGYIAK